MIIIGICGGTGSGKTSVARKVLEAIGGEKVLLLSQDCYYKDNSHRTQEERNHINFDHPDALDRSLLIDHLEALKLNRSVNQPVYDFTTHSRKPEQVRLEPHPVVVVEGILIFVDKKLRDLFDLKVFVDTDPDVRFIRRLRRDIVKRGRTIDSVVQQYLQTVRPMHLEFVEPSKRYADVIIPEGAMNAVGVEFLIERIRASLL
ncbi:MAG TPA: uridine kinase [Terriglobia bacterium]|nr:uridine kinase [Terriglobia bacterium]